jgi:hypothetical protein
MAPPTFPPSLGTPNSAFGVAYGSILGEDPEYHHGKRQIVWKLCHLEEITWNWNRAVQDGMLWLSWDEKGFRFVLSGRIHDYSALGPGLGIGFRRDDVSAFMNTPALYLYFANPGGSFETNRVFPIAGRLSRRGATHTHKTARFTTITITSMTLAGLMILDPQQEQPRW